MGAPSTCGNRDEIGESCSDTPILASSDKNKRLSKLDWVNSKGDTGHSENTALCNMVLAATTLFMLISSKVSESRVAIGSKGEWNGSKPASSSKGVSI